jgi:transposase
MMGYTASQIRKITNHHDNNIRKWIHQLNEKGIEGIISKKKHNRKQYKFDNDMEKKIVDIASSNPRSYGLGFSTWWSLRVLAGFIICMTWRLLIK